MKFKNILLLVFLLSFMHLNLIAQIDKVMVETYYISDTTDATDTTGGWLEAGSKTFRIYLDLAYGWKVKKIYGDTNHLLKFSSTQIFFNNISEGQTFAKDISKSRLEENTVALDTWLTLGAVTKIASKIVGVPKICDTNGSFIGGANNDGGSAVISYGLLTNADPLAGIPLTTSDGNDTLTLPSGSWFDYGILSSNSDDSTIFGSIVPDSVFECNDCGLQYSGIGGVNPDSNFVLLAQLTTKGDISFELNVELVDSTGAIIKYVANDSVLLGDEVLNRNLKYPFESVCGCPDSDYLEYLADRDCDNLDSCINLVVFGCMDPLACNYDSNANVNVSSLCCYPGLCNDRDLAFVCPELITTRMNEAFEIFPNPAQESLAVQLQKAAENSNYRIYNALGKLVLENEIRYGELNFPIDITNLEAGLYFIQLINGGTSFSKTFIKE